MEGFTPGWNDPPKNVRESTGNLKINLNKRVAFPLSSGALQQSNAAPLLLPPTVSPRNIPPMPQAGSIPPLPEKIVSILRDDELDLQKEKVIETLSKGVAELNANIKSSVASKLKTLEDDWSKVDNEVKSLLVELSQFLDKKDTKNAAIIQRKIVLKGVNGQWLLAVRQVIVNLEQREVPEEQPINASE